MCFPDGCTGSFEASYDVPDQTSFMDGAGLIVAITAATVPLVGHPRLESPSAGKAWMAGINPAMTAVMN
jgi:hypothetical protein